MNRDKVKKPAFIAAEQGMIVHSLPDLFGQQANPVFTRIDAGENPLRAWRRFRRKTIREVADGLNLTQREYRIIERDIHSSYAEDIDNFCLLMSIHPTDLTSEAQPMASALCEVLIERAKRFEQPRSKRDKALFALHDELDKAERFIGEARKTPMRQGNPLIGKAVERLALDHPLAHRRDTFDKVSARIDCLDGDWLMLQKEAETQYEADRKTYNRLERRMRLFSLYVLDDAQEDSGDRLNRAVGEMGVVKTARAFTREPEDFGAPRWPSSRRIMIEGRVYDWEGACEAMFDCLIRWQNVKNDMDASQTMIDATARDIESFDNWRSADSTIDAIQALANVALIKRELGDYPGMQKRLERFGARPSQKLAKTGFLPG